VVAHALERHLPWFLDPASTCYMCHQACGRPSSLRLHTAHQGCFIREREDSANVVLYGIDAERWVAAVDLWLSTLAVELGLPSRMDLVNFATERRLHRSQEPERPNAATQLYSTLRSSGQAIRHAPPNCVADLLDERTLVLLVTRVTARTRLLPRCALPFSDFLYEPWIGPWPVQVVRQAPRMRCNP
jgi:hypothetical protein